MSQMRTDCLYFGNAIMDCTELEHSHGKLSAITIIFDQKSISMGQLSQFDVGKLERQLHYRFDKAGLGSFWVALSSPP
jgi:hypothetical protein